MADPRIEFFPLTNDRWPDFERLLGPNGAVGGCWCMWWRQTRKEFGECHGERNHEAMRTIVSGGDVPGLLAYVDGVPAGWVSMGPRSNYPSLQRSRTLKPVDDTPAWAIVCFLVAKEHRGQGMMAKLITAAVDYARGKGATVIEAFPEESKSQNVPAAFSGAYMGLRPAFEAAGFVEIAKRGRQPVMRKSLS